MSDYKEAIQEYADQIASQEYDRDFYDLSMELREKVYVKAQEMYTDDFASQADSEREREVSKA